MNTTYFLNLVADNLFRGDTSPKIPAAYYIGLSTTAPQANMTGVTEPSASAGYTRVQLTALSEAASGIVTNSGDIAFPESTGSWGKVTHYVIYDAKTGASLLMYGELPTPRTIEAETQVVIKAGSLKLSIQNNV